MCIYCDAYADEHPDEDGKTASESERSTQQTPTRPSNGVLATLRSLVTDLL